MAATELLALRNTKSDGAGRQKKKKDGGRVRYGG